MRILTLVVLIGCLCGQAFGVDPSGDDTLAGISEVELSVEKLPRAALTSGLRDRDFKVMIEEALQDRQITPLPPRRLKDSSRRAVLSVSVEVMSLGNLGPKGPRGANDTKYVVNIKTTLKQYVVVALALKEDAENAKNIRYPAVTWTETSGLDMVRSSSLKTFIQRMAKNQATVFAAVAASKTKKLEAELAATKDE